MTIIFGWKNDYLKIFVFVKIFKNWLLQVAVRMAEWSKALRSGRSLVL